jgi:hypothetical protein
MDVMKCLSFTRTVNIPVLGLIENMSGYVCPCCGEISNVFSTGGGQAMAAREGLRFLGSLPVDTELVDLLDSGSIPEADGKTSGISHGTFPLLVQYETTQSARLFKSVTSAVVQGLAGSNH